MDERTLVDELRDEGLHLHVVDNLIARLWGALAFGGGQDPPALLRAIRDELAGFSDAALADAAKALRGTRSTWPSAAKAREAAQAAQARHMVRIEPGSTAWSAWSAEWHRQGAAGVANFYLRQGWALVPREFPAVAASPAPGSGRAA